MLRVWFHRSRAVAWVLVGVASFLLGWTDSVTLVLIASLYANVVTDWGAAEAADNREVLRRIASLEKKVEED